MVVLAAGATLLVVLVTLLGPVCATGTYDVAMSDDTTTSDDTIPEFNPESALQLLYSEYSQMHGIQDIWGQYDLMNIAALELYCYFNGSPDSDISDLFISGYCDYCRIPDYTDDVIGWIQAQVGAPSRPTALLAEFCAVLVLQLPASDYARVPSLLASTQTLPDWSQSARTIWYMERTLAAPEFPALHDPALLAPCYETVRRGFPDRVDDGVFRIWRRLLQRTDTGAAATLVRAELAQLPYLHGIRLFYPCIAPYADIRAVLGRLGLPSDDDDLVTDLLIELQFFDGDLDGLAGVSLFLLSQSLDQYDSDTFVKQLCVRVLDHILPYQYERFLTTFGDALRRVLMSLSTQLEQSADDDLMRDHSRRLVRLAIDVTVSTLHYFMERFPDPTHMQSLVGFLGRTFWEENDQLRLASVFYKWMQLNQPLRLSSASSATCVLIPLLKSAALARSPIGFRLNLFQYVTWAARYVSGPVHRLIVYDNQGVSLPMMIAQHPLWPQDPERDLQNLRSVIAQMPPDLCNMNDNVGRDLVTLLERHPALEDHDDAVRDLIEFVRARTAEVVPARPPPAEIASLMDQVADGMLRYCNRCSVCRQPTGSSLQELLQLIQQHQIGVRPCGHTFHVSCLKDATIQCELCQSEREPHA